MSITSTSFQAPLKERVGLIPSVYDQILTIGADETPLLSLIGTSVVKGISHSWLIDNLAQPSKNAKIEISDFVGQGKSTKQKRTNEVQILTTDIEVSKTMQKVATYGGSELQHEVSKKAKEHKREIEYALFGLGRDNDVHTSVFKKPTLRTDNVAGEMAGLFYFLAKDATEFTSGIRGNVQAFDKAKNWTKESTQNAYTVLTEDILHTILQRIYDAGETPKDVFLGAELKKAINKIASRQFGNEKNINSSVVSLDTDFGKVNFRLHRYLSENYGLGDVLLAGNFDYMKMGLLYPTEINDVTTSKTAIAKRYYTEGCLELRNADAFSVGVGLKA